MPCGPGTTQSTMRVRSHLTSSWALLASFYRQGNRLREVSGLPGVRVGDEGPGYAPRQSDCRAPSCAMPGRVKFWGTRGEYYLGRSESFLDNKTWTSQCWNNGHYLWGTFHVPGSGHYFEGSISFLTTLRWRRRGCSFSFQRRRC